MCPPSASSISNAVLPQWRLEERESTWRLVVTAASSPEIELSSTAVRLQLKAGEAPVTLPVPEKALPIDTDVAKCSFSRKRCELSVDWPIREAATASKPAQASEEVNASRGDKERLVEQMSAAIDESTGSATMKTSQDEIAQDVEAAMKGAATEDADVANTSDAVSGAATSAGNSDGSVAAANVVEVSDEVVDSAGPEVAAEDSVKLSPEEWKARGNDAVKAEDLDEAVRCYSAGIGAASGDLEAVLRSNRALCLHKLGRYEDALEDAKRCTALKPDFFKGYLRGAMALRALGRAEEAFAFVKRCPRHDEAEALAAELRPEADAAENARIAALGGAEKAKEEGNQLFRKGLFEPALVKYTEALDLCEDQDGAIALALRNNRAACNHQLSNFKAVVADASFVLDREPNNFKALVRRMLALEPLERYEAALQDVRAVLRQDPRHQTANRLQHSLGKIVRDMQRNGGA